MQQRRQGPDSLSPEQAVQPLNSLRLCPPSHCYPGSSPPRRRQTHCQGGRAISDSITDPKASPRFAVRPKFDSRSPPKECLRSRQRSPRRACALSHLVTERRGAASGGARRAGQGEGLCHPARAKGKGVKNRVREQKGVMRRERGLAPR